MKIYLTVTKSVDVVQADYEVRSIKEKNKKKLKEELKYANIFTMSLCQIKTLTKIIKLKQVRHLKSCNATQLTYIVTFLFQIYRLD